MARKRGLGRGLDALLQAPSPTTPEEGSTSGPQRLSLDAISPNDNQPRRDFDEDALAGLSASIASQGLVQPIVVTPQGDDRYRIVAGERRWRAARMAGLGEVPVVVLEVESEQHLLELALVENLQREDLNPVEEAMAFQALVDDFGLSQNELAQRVGKARSTVANSLRLLNLPDSVLGFLREGLLSAGQARPLLALSGDEERVRLAQQAVDHDWTAREVEQRVSQIGSQRGEPSTPAATAPPRDVHDGAAEEALTRRLQTRVQIHRRRGGRGQLRLHFHSEEELMRLYDLLVQAAT